MFYYFQTDTVSVL